MKTPMLPASTASVAGKSNYIAKAIGFALSCIVGAAPLYADDTEVFFGQLPVGSSSKPNLLFVLDTSSSMTAHDGYTLDRLGRMKQALVQILEESNNVNIGIMRFNGAWGGASVVYPMTDVNLEVCEDENCGEISLIGRIDSANDDVAENLDSGTVTIDADELSVTDAQTIGLRFTDMRIPKGARITKALLEYQADQDNSESTSLSISAEAVGNSPAFTSDSANVTGRTTGGESVTYAVSSWQEDEFYESADISSVIQEVVDQDDWCGGQAMSIFINSSGTRFARSFEGSGGSAPVALKLSYDSTTIPSDGGCTVGSLIATLKQGNDDAEENLDNNYMYMDSSDLELPKDNKQQLIGIRFSDINIPANSIISSAKIKFQVDEQKSGDISLLIKAEDTGDAQTFNDDRYELSSRTKTSQQVIWSDLPDSGVGSNIETDDLSNMVQHLVNRSDWDSGNAMAFYLKRHSGSTSKKRTVESYEGDQSGSAKLYIDYQVSSGSASTGSTILAKDRMIDIVGDIQYASGTPIVDAYYEAANYYLGRPVDYGRMRGSYQQGHGDKRKTRNRVSHPGSHDGNVLRSSSCSDTNLGGSNCRTETIIAGANYISPMASSCQTNNIIFLSDGGASSNSSVDKVKSLTGLDSCTGHNNEKCGRDLATWLYDTDHSSYANTQNIITYTVGFNLEGNKHAQQFLRDIASNGGGNYKDAESAGELATAFKAILRDVNSIDTSFTAPGATVNQYNRLTHRNDIYFATFKPTSTPLWPGNLKRYHIGQDAADEGEIAIRDRNYNLAVDSDTGFFKDTAKSWWVETDDDGAAISTADGFTVTRGGAAGQLKLEGPGGNGSRNVYTFVGDTVPTGGVDLTATAQSLSEDNDALTNEILGIVNVMSNNSDQAQYRTNLLKWIRGVDINDSDEDGEYDEIRRQIGAPMHSRPLIVNYKKNGHDTSIVYLATNDGYLHAIDTDDGEEQFAFVPKELLPVMQEGFINSASTKHPYGLDGAMTTMLIDPNGNSMIEASATHPEQAYLYVGMRRGGDNYYGFNITNPDKPKLAWTIKGGDTGFEELGQSWSRATPAKIIFEDESRDVLIFGAGYDTNQDPDPTGATMTQSADSIGRGIYIVDARTGEKIWSALGSSTGDQEFSDMDYSIPADIRIVDVDMDGYADQLYTADMGGQIWRFDMQKYHQTGNLISSGGVIARLNGDNNDDHRRFYGEPDVALIEAGGKRFMSVSIGSGWRAHPLDNVVNDRFYVIKSHAVRAAPEGYGKSSGNGESQSWSPITENDLQEVDGSLNPPVNDYGWYIELPDNGEKVLSKSVTFDNKVIFTSYAPEAVLDNCAAAAIGKGYEYALDVTSGAAVLDLNHDNGTDIDESDVRYGLGHGGIPPEPTVLITESGEPVVLIGTEKLIAPLENRTKRTFWAEHGPASTVERTITTEVIEN